VLFVVGEAEKIESIVLVFQTKTLVKRNINYREWMIGKKKNQENQNANLKPSSFFRPFGIILIVMD
jgi:hypothetical protein